MDKAFDFHWQHNEFEVRVTHNILNGDPYIELVHWYNNRDGRPLCYTIAYWKRHKDGGYNLCFVGDRMLELQKLDIGSIWPQLCAAQVCLDEWERQTEKEL